MNCSSHGTWSNSQHSCICDPAWVLADCSAHWTSYSTLYNTFKWTFQTCYIILFLFTAYRWLYIYNVKRAHDAGSGMAIHPGASLGGGERERRTTGTATVGITSTALQPRVSNGREFLARPRASTGTGCKPSCLERISVSAWYKDQQLVILGLILSTFCIYIVLFVDPFSSQHIYSVLFMRSLYVVASLCLVTAAGRMIRFFMKIQAKFHPPTRKIVRGLDIVTAVLVLLNVAALALQPYDNSLSQVSGNVITGAYVLLLVIGSSIYSITILRQVIQPKHKTLRGHHAGGTAPSIKHEQLQTQPTLSGPSSSSLPYDPRSPRSKRTTLSIDIDLDGSNSGGIKADMERDLPSPRASPRPNTRPSPLQMSQRSYQEQQQLADRERVRDAKRLVRVVRASQIFAVMGVTIVLVEFIYEPVYIVPQIFIALETSIRAVEISTLCAILIVMGRARGMEVAPARQQQQQQQQDGQVSQIMSSQGQDIQSRHHRRTSYNPFSQQSRIVLDIDITSPKSRARATISAVGLSTDVAKDGKDGASDRNAMVHVESIPLPGPDEQQHQQEHEQRQQHSPPGQHSSRRRRERRDRRDTDVMTSPSSGRSPRFANNFNLPLPPGSPSVHRHAARHHAPVYSSQDVPGVPDGAEMSILTIDTRDPSGDAKGDTIHLKTEQEILQSEDIISVPPRERTRILVTTHEKHTKLGSSPQSQVRFSICIPANESATVALLPAQYLPSLSRSTASLTSTDTTPTTTTTNTTTTTSTTNTIATVFGAHDTSGSMSLLSTPLASPSTTLSSCLNPTRVNDIIMN